MRGATPAEVERALEAAAARHVDAVAGRYDRIATEVGQLYEGQLAAKDAAPGEKNETIATQRELRRRAKASGRDESRRQMAPSPLNAAPMTTAADTPTSPAPADGLWRRALGGE